MGILQEKVREAFASFKSGDLSGFAKGLVDAGDVRWDWHRGIVDAEVEAQLEKIAGGDIE